jgi:hypothetical protein
MHPTIDLDLGIPRVGQTAAAGPVEISDDNHHNLVACRMYRFRCYGALLRDDRLRCRRGWMK